MPERNCELPVGIVHGGVKLIERAVDHFVARAADAHDLVAGVHLLHISVQFAQTLLARR